MDEIEKDEILTETEDVLIVKCKVCKNLYDQMSSSICPYCNYTQEQRISYLNNKRKTGGKK